MELDPETLRVAIEQEWEMFRYQDELRWSKIQTLLTVEAALLVGIYSSPASVTIFMQLILALVGLMVVCAISALAEKDGRDATYHLQRAEELLPLARMLPIKKPKYVLGISGSSTLRTALLLVAIFNVAVVVEVFRRWSCA